RCSTPTRSRRCRRAKARSRPEPGSRSSSCAERAYDLETMEIELRLFAVFRERAGRESLPLELPEGATVADAIAAASRQPGLEEILARMPVRAALNREYVDEDATVSAGDEIALIPPVSGGATAAPRARVT